MKNQMINILCGLKGTFKSKLKKKKFFFQVNYKE